MEINLIVEADGSQHGDKKHSEKDYERDRFLKKEGYSIIRLWSSDIIQFSDETCQLIYENIQEIMTNK
ncbi:MAG: DUF559 domain-containing protein [Candidatus Marinimicrobia bacterium]|nr:DUF559 domain-containing protein [Candidatus Neomarinimicrobiota bacterium]